MLSSVHPTLKYAESSIMTLAYGHQPDGSVALGSIIFSIRNGALKFSPLPPKRRRNWQISKGVFGHLYRMAEKSIW